MIDLETPAVSLGMFDIPSAHGLMSFHIISSSGHEERGESELIR